MSWYSDKEKFDEHDPDYCANCEGGDSFEECQKCAKRHEDAVAVCEDVDCDYWNYCKQKGSVDCPWWK